eukprot:gene13575-16052_t
MDSLLPSATAFKTALEGLDEPEKERDTLMSSLQDWSKEVMNRDESEFASPIDLAGRTRSDSTNSNQSNTEIIKWRRKSDPDLKSSDVRRVSCLDRACIFSDVAEDAGKLEALENISRDSTEQLPSSAEFKARTDEKLEALYCEVNSVSSERDIALSKFREAEHMFQYYKVELVSSKQRVEVLKKKLAMRFNGAQAMMQGLLKPEVLEIEDMMTSAADPSQDEETVADGDDSVTNDVHAQLQEKLKQTEQENGHLRAHLHTALEK